MNTISIIKVFGILFVVGILCAFSYSQGQQKAQLQLAQYKLDAELHINDLEHQNDTISQRNIDLLSQKTQVITEKQIQYRDKITQLPSSSSMTNAWVEIHDSSATQTFTDPTKAADSTPSDVDDLKALGTTVDNYAICHKNSEQLMALQAWIRENQKAVEENPR